MGSGYKTREHSYRFSKLTLKECHAGTTCQLLVRLHYALTLCQAPSQCVVLPFSAGQPEWSQARSVLSPTALGLAGWGRGLLKLGQLQLHLFYQVAIILCVCHDEKKSWETIL